MCSFPLVVLLPLPQNDPLCERFSSTSLEYIDPRPLSHCVFVHVFLFHSSPTHRCYQYPESPRCLSSRIGACFDIITDWEPTFQMRALPVPLHCCVHFWHWNEFQKRLYLQIGQIHSEVIPILGRADKPQSNSRINLTKSRTNLIAISEMSKFGDALNQICSPPLIPRLL